MFWYCCTHVGTEGDELLVLFQTVMCSAAGRCKVGVEGLMEGRRFAWASEDSEMQNSPWPSQNRRVEEFWLILDVHVVSVGASDGGWDGRWLLVQFVVLLAFVYDSCSWTGLGCSTESCITSLLPSRTPLHLNLWCWFLLYFIFSLLLAGFILLCGFRLFVYWCLRYM